MHASGLGGACHFPRSRCLRAHYDDYPLLSRPELRAARTDPRRSAEEKQKPEYDLSKFEDFKGFLTIQVPTNVIEHVAESPKTQPLPDSLKDYNTLLSVDACGGMMVCRSPRARLCKWGARDRCLPSVALQTRNLSLRDWSSARRGGVGQWDAKVP